MQYGKRILMSLAMLMYLFQASIVGASEYYDKEYSYETGMTWGFQEDGTTYDVSDGEIAEIVRDEDGTEQVKFKRPGDVYVTAWIPWMESSIVYLIHVTGHPVDETAVNQETFAQEVLDLVNQERAKARRRPLRLSDELLYGAAVRAEEISRHYSHTRPNGKTFHTVLEKRQNSYLGENIAGGATFPEQVVQMWMDSEGHRKNILNSRFKELGVGYIYVPGSEYEHYWVQIFRGK